MRNAVLSFLLLALFFSNASGQGQRRQRNHSKKIQYVKIPRAQVLVILVNQPDSPVKIEFADCLLRLDTGKTLIRYKARNRSSKSVTSFTVVSWNSTGAGGSLPVVLPKSTPLMLPGSDFDSMSTEMDYDILAWTEKVRNGLSEDTKVLFEGKMVQIYFLLVDQVYFTDGTLYKDQELSNSLSNYLSERFCDPRSSVGAKLPFGFRGIPSP